MATASHNKNIRDGRRNRGQNTLARVVYIVELNKATAIYRGT